MSGHSKWSTIKRQKGAADLKRGLTFTKIANLITISTRLGGSGDPQANPRLRSALDSAREVNMPKDNIQRAIDRGLGNLPGQTIDEVFYEGFGPQKVAFFIEGVTDNKLRTNAEIKNLFDKSGGALGGQGSTSYMFDKIAEIVVESKGLPAGSQGGEVESEILELIDLGADDVEDFDDSGVKKYSVIIQFQELNSMSTKVTQQGYKITSAEIIMRPNISTEIKDKEAAQKVIEFVEKLENHDDIQKVYNNMELSGELSKQLE